MNTGLSQSLGKYLQGAGAESNSGGYSVERVLKETASECTELVRDTDGTPWVRKLFVRDDASLEQAYLAIRSLASPWLPRIRDVHRSAAGTVVVREYLAGQTLRQRVEGRGALGESEARSLLRQVCLGVRALHTLDPPLIHRDVNPSNVIVTDAGARLIDFGIARAYDEHASRDTHAWGTTGYAAPEQFGFDQSDERTDVFALGMLYWFLLTGTDPQGNLAARLRQDAEAGGAGAGGIAEVPASARGIIERCVALAPEARFSSVDALITALAEADAKRAAREPAAPAELQARETRARAGSYAEAGAKRAARARENAPEPAKVAARAACGRGDGDIRDAASLPRTVLARAWLVASTGFMAFLVLAVVITLAEPWRLSVPQGWAHALAFCLATLFMFAPTWLLTTNLFRLRERLPIVRSGTPRRRLLVCAAICAASFFIGACLANAATLDLPEAYVQLMQANGGGAI